MAETGKSNNRGDSGGGDRDDRPARPHTFFWLVLSGMVPAVATAIAADKRTPGYALGSEWVYYLEIGFAVFLGCYLLALAIVLSYQGRSIGRLELPGGGGMQPPDPAQLQVAANAFEEFQEETRLRLKDDTASIASLEERVQTLQDDAHRLRATQEAEERYRELQGRLDALEQRE